MIKNPIINELKKLKLINKSDFNIISNTTRDKKIRVIKDKKSKIIFLEKFASNKNYYKYLRYNDNDRKNIDKIKKITKVKTFTGIVKTPLIDDDVRRFNQFKNFLKNKEILDFGCGWGGFLNKIKNAKSINGVELRVECIDYIKNKFKKIKIFNNLDLVTKKFDIITAFHVLEHIPYQINTLKLLKSKLKNNGRIIIEVPHAEDFLILQDELKEFKKFTFWSEHLVLHTHTSLKKVLQQSGFKNIKIKYLQRYNFANHLGWFLKKKPGGHNSYANITSYKLNKEYKNNLVRLGQTDTLIAEANI